jgi:hypothetical protein
LNAPALGGGGNAGGGGGAHRYSDPAHQNMALGVQRVAAANLEVLVRFATEMWIADLELRDILLLTHKSYCSSCELAEALLSRFTSMMPVRKRPAPTTVEYSH